MSRQGTSGAVSLLIFFPIFLLLCAGCGAAQVLGIPAQEAAGSLERGDIGFILRADLPKDIPGAAARLRQLERIHPAAAYYAGLQAEAQGSGEEGDRAIPLFCAALGSTSLPAGKEAARKLIAKVLNAPENGPAPDYSGILDYADSIHTAGNAGQRILRAACLYRLGRYEEARATAGEGTGGNDTSGNDTGDESFGQWGKAIALFAEQALNMDATDDGLPDFLIGMPQGDARDWAYREALSPERPLAPDLSAVLAGRLAAGNFPALISAFRPALRDGGAFILRHPELIPDLGRAYQYAPAMRDEGIALFKAWNASLENSAEADRDARYRLLYYLGRMERAGGKYSDSTESFGRALDFAPDALQSDACLWYILSNELSKSPYVAALIALSLMPQWNDASYFADILDQIACHLTTLRQWSVLQDIFTGLKSMDADRKAGASLAQYAWILGRAVQEGYYSSDQSAEDFFRTVYREGRESLYYRAMAAWQLGESFMPEKDGGPEQGVPDSEAAPDSETGFLLGFFRYGAAQFALPHIKAAESSLAAADLRMIAEAFASYNMWKDSLDLVSRRLLNEGGTVGRADLLLFYPRPYRELTEKYAAEAGMGAELLFGLIRTESYFMHDIVSRSDAVGLTQLMVPTAEDMAGRIARRSQSDYRGLDRESLKEPAMNIHIGSYYLNYLKTEMKTPMLALLAYNGGMGRVRRWLAADRRKDGGLPDDLFLETIEYRETREYGRRVLASAAVYGYLYYGMTMEATAAKIFSPDVD